MEDNYDCFFVQTLNVVAIGALEGALGGGEEVGEGVAADGGADGACQSFEDALNLVVLVGALGLDVEVHAGGIAQRLEEVEKHLGRHITYLLAVERGIPHKPGTAPEVEADGAEAVVHGEGVAVALDAALAAQGLMEAFAEG